MVYRYTECYQTSGTIEQVVILRTKISQKKVITISHSKLRLRENQVQKCVNDTFATIG